MFQLFGIPDAFYIVVRAVPRFFHGSEFIFGGDAFNSGTTLSVLEGIELGTRTFGIGRVGRDNIKLPMLRYKRRGGVGTGSSTDLDHQFLTPLIMARSWAAAL